MKDSKTCEKPVKPLETMEQKPLVLYLRKVSKERFRKDFNSAPKMVSEGDGRRLERMNIMLSL